MTNLVLISLWAKLRLITYMDFGSSLAGRLQMYLHMYCPSIFASGHVVLHEPTSHLGTVGGEGGGGGNFWGKKAFPAIAAREALEHRLLRSKLRSEVTSKAVSNLRGHLRLTAMVKIL